MNRLMEVYLYWRTSTGENVQFICKNFYMMKTLAISIPSDDLFKDDFCNDKRIALLQHTVLCIRVHTTGELNTACYSSTTQPPI